LVTLHFTKGAQWMKTKQVRPTSYPRKVFEEIFQNF
jgi:hypothetical protein